MSNANKFVKNSFILSIGTFLPKLASFITLPILTGCLTKEDYGQYDLFVVMASLILPIATLQIQTAAFRFLINVRGNREKENVIISNILLFVIPVSIIVLTIVFFILYDLPMSVRIAACLYFGADCIYGVFGQIARGLSYNSVYSMASILNSAGSVIFTVLLVSIMDKMLFGAVLTLCVSYCIGSLFIFFRIKLKERIHISYIDISKLKQMIKYSWPMVPNSMSMWVMRLSDRLVIRIFLGLEANAIYAAANKIPQILTLAQNTFTMAWQENASETVNEENVEQYYSQMFKVIFRLMAGFMSFLIGICPILFSLLIRGDYRDAYPHIPILLIAMFFFTMASFLGGIYVAYMKTANVGITTTIAAACNLIIDLLCVKKIGVYAASLSTLISYILLCIYRMVDVQKIVKLKYDIPFMTVVTLILSVQCYLFTIDNIVYKALNCLGGVFLMLFMNRDTLKRLFQVVINKIKK